MGQIGNQDYPFTDVKENGAIPAVKVRGTTSDSTSERLATQSDQASGNSLLSTLAGSLASVISKGLYVTPWKKEVGVQFAGIGFPVSNEEYAELKFQTQNIQRIPITEVETEYDINLTPDGTVFTFAEINQISIGGFNLSVDTALQFTFYVNINGTKTPFYDFFVGYGSPNYNEKNGEIKFFPNVVGEWDRDRLRYGSLVVTYLGTATTPQHLFWANVTVTPFEQE